MPTLTNSFEGGPASVAISTANSGGTSGDAFDGVTTAGGTTATYSTAHPTRGSTGAAFGIPASAGQAAYVAYSTSLTAVATAAALYARRYIFLTASPPIAYGIVRGLSGASQRWRVALNTSRKIEARAADNSVIGTSTTTLALSTPYRIEVSATGSTTGSIEVRIYAGEDTTPTETMGPYTPVNLGGPVAEIRFGVTAAVGAATAMIDYCDDIGASTVTWLGPATPTPTISTGPWAGAVTSSSFTVSWITANISTVRLAVALTSDMANPVFSPVVTVDSDGVAKCTISGLAADTLYYYAPEADGTILGTGTGQLRTDPARGSQASFSVAFGSCQQTNSNATTFSAIRDQTGPYGQARRVLHLGDLHYAADAYTGSTTQANVLAQLQSSVSQANMAAMLAKIPMPYTFDNHDWNGVDSYAGSPAAAVTKAAYRQFVPHPALPADSSGGGTGGVWYSEVVGRVRFIHLDTRSQRSLRTDPESASKTLLGAEQKEWFKTELAKAEPVKIICSGIYWRLDSSTGDRWGSYSTEWAEIKDYIQDNGLTGLYVVFGDRHALTADDGTSAGCYLPQAGGAPFDQGSTTSSETWSQTYYDTGGANLKGYGWLDVTDSGDTITIDYKGYTSADGIVRTSMSTTFSPVSPPSSGGAAAAGIPAPLPFLLGLPAGSPSVYTTATARFDYAIGGIPFMSAASRDMPAVRKTAPLRKQQFDNSLEPGEQSLDGWWLRSQATWHGGAGQRWGDPGLRSDENATLRFWDSAGVDVSTQGQISLLKSTSRVAPKTALKLVPYVDPAYGDAVFGVNASEVLFYPLVGSRGAEVIPSGATGGLMSCACEGSNFYVAAGNGVYSRAVSAAYGSGGWTKIWDTTSTVARLGWAKQRLILADNTGVYELVGTGPTLPTAKYTWPSGGSWVPTGIAESGTAIYVSGYSATASVVLKFTIDSAGAMPTLSQGAVVAELPRGEQVHSMLGVLGSYVAIGTNRGVRVAGVASSGDLEYGPLIFASTTPVTGWCAFDRFVFCTVTGSGEHNSGLYRIDLGVENDSLRFSYAADIDTDRTDQTTCTAVTVAGASSRKVFATANGIYAESDTAYEPTGWIQSSRIRWATVEPKIVKFARLRGPAPQGSVGVSIISDDDTSLPVVTWAGEDILGAEDIALPRIGPQDYVSLRLQLTRSDDTVSSPIVEGWQLKALPAAARQRIITLPLRCFDVEQDGAGGRFGRAGYAAERIMSLEDLERAGDVIAFQDLGTGVAESVVIDEVEFRQSAPGDGGNVGGVLIVTLRTV